MTDVPSHLSAREAAMRVVAGVRCQPPLRVPLDDALGMVLADDVRSPVDVPPRTSSSMDGYAARAADVRGATAERPAVLRLVERIPAGSVPTRALGPGECARVFTGSPVPAGTDTVVRQEDAAADGEHVRIVTDRDAGANLRQPGEDIRRDAVALTAGLPLRAAHLGVLASLGIGAPMVVRRPRVAILCCGDEVADVDRPDEIQDGRRIGNASGHALRALIRQAGGEPVDLGIASDTLGSIRDHLARAADADLVVTAGGISVGDHDQVRAAVQASGGAVDFWRVRIRPGGPVAAGSVAGIPWVGLPGNPVSAMVTCELFVRPAIRKMAGHAEPFRRCRPVRTAAAISLRPTLQHFLRAVVSGDGEGREARLTGPQGSGILSSMAAANALLIVPEGQHETPAGAGLSALLLDEAEHQGEPGF
ncbi:MAG TPA: gephyrin-like molybdotransferase Glp [Gemmatimonadales bacterium]|nr:gephyrin-like molybdotransferase Glp [Gemmatimonadales bacterium]